MKKILFLYCLIFLNFNVFHASISDNDNVFNFISYKSANSLKSELYSIKRQIKRNELKMKTVHLSKTLSKNEKRKKISILKLQNNELERKIKKIKSEYKKILSCS